MRKSLIFLVLILPACGKEKSCLQPTVTKGTVESRLARDLSVEFIVQERSGSVPLLIDLKAGSKDRHVLSRGTDTRTTAYGKLDFKGKDPECDANSPYEYGYSLLGLSAKSFGVVKACWPKYSGPTVAIVEKTESCPTDYWEQKKPEYPSGEEPRFTSTATGTSVSVR